MYLIFVSLFLVSCGSIPQSSDSKPSSKGTITEELKPYVDMFLDDAGEFRIRPDISGLDIKFKHIDRDNVAGTCIAYSSDPPDIYVDIRIWDRLCEIQRKMLIYHEMGHCVLGYGHRKKSIMNTKLYSCAFYEQNEPYLIRELFVNDSELSLTEPEDSTGYEQ